MTPKSLQEREKGKIIFNIKCFMLSPLFRFMREDSIKMCSMRHDITKDYHILLTGDVCIERDLYDICLSLKARFPEKLLLKCDHAFKSISGKIL